jgi:hypothetical protein
MSIARLCAEASTRLTTAQKSERLRALPFGDTAFSKLVQIGTDPRLHTAVKFLDRDGKRKEEIVPSSMLVSQSRELVTLLADRGYLWPPNQALRNKIIGEWSVASPTYSLGGIGGGSKLEWSERTMMRPLVRPLLS